MPNKSFTLTGRVAQNIFGILKAANGPGVGRFGNEQDLSCFTDAFPAIDRNTMTEKLGKESVKVEVSEKIQNRISATISALVLVGNLAPDQVETYREILTAIGDTQVSTDLDGKINDLTSIKKALAG